MIHDATTLTTGSSADVPIERRAHGDRGAGLVAAVALMFSFTFLGLVWLARDVDRSNSNQSAARSIAFQAARTGAQAASISDLRAGVVRIDPRSACASARRAADRLFASYGVAGSLTGCDVDPSGTKVTVEATISDGGRTVRGVGIVSAERTE